MSSFSTSSADLNNLNWLAVALVLAATFSCSNSGSGGVVTMQLTDTQTAAIEAGRYVYDLVITDGSGSKSRVVEGQATVTPGVTRS